MKQIKKKQPYIIEFNGLPGSGKTEITNHIIKFSNLKRKNYITLREIEKELFKNSRLKKVLALLTVFFKPSNIKFLFIAFLLLVDVTAITKERVRRVQRLIILFFTYNYIEKKASSVNIIVDQGIIQQILSILHLEILGKDRSIRRLLKHVKKNIRAFHVINTDIDIEVVSQRLQRRERKFSRIDQLSVAEVRPALQIQQNNLKHIRKIIKDLKLNTLTVSTNDQPEINAKLIIKRFNAKC